MLDSVAALMGSDSRRSDIPSIVDICTEVHRLCLRVEMVSKGARDASDLDIVNPIVRKHLLGNFAAAHGTSKRNLAILINPAVQGLLDYPARDHYNQENQPDIHNSSIKKSGRPQDLPDM